MAANELKFAAAPAADATVTPAAEWRGRGVHRLNKGICRRETGRRSKKRVCDAADQPGLSAGPLPLLRSRILVITYRTDPESCAPWCRNRWRSTSRWSSTSSSACRIRPASATIPRAARSSRFPSAAARAATPTACSSTTIRRSPAAASSGAFRRSSRSPRLRAEIDTLVGTLDYGPVRVATGTMGYKHSGPISTAIKASLAGAQLPAKIIPHVDGTPRICELVEYHLEDVMLKGAWTGPAALDRSAARAGAGRRAAGAGGHLRRPHSAPT